MTVALYAAPGREGDNHEERSGPYFPMVERGDGLGIDRGLRAGAGPRGPPGIAAGMPARRADPSDAPPLGPHRARQVPRLSRELHRAPPGLLREGTVRDAGLQGR